MDNQTIIISFGLLSELIGGILLASEMVGLLDKMRGWNSSLRDKIQSKKIKLATEFTTMRLTAVLLQLVAYRGERFGLGEFRLRYRLTFSGVVFFLCILIIMNSISDKLLRFLECLVEKLGTKRVLGLLGIGFLCLGFVCQAFINFTHI